MLSLLNPVERKSRELTATYNSLIARLYPQNCSDGGNDRYSLLRVDDVMDGIAYDNNQEIHEIGSHEKQINNDSSISYEQILQSSSYNSIVDWLVNKLCKEANDDKEVHKLFYQYYKRLNKDIIDLPKLGILDLNHVEHNNMKITGKLITNPLHAMYYGFKFKNCIRVSPNAYKNLLVVFINNKPKILIDLNSFSYFGPCNTTPPDIHDEYVIKLLSENIEIDEYNFYEHLVISYAKTKLSKEDKWLPF